MGCGMMGGHDGHGSNASPGMIKHIKGSSLKPSNIAAV